MYNIKKSYVLKNAELKYFNTFKVSGIAKYVMIAYSEKDLFKLCKKAMYITPYTLILGAGSNTLFTDNYQGTIIINKIKGITISDKKNYWYLHINAGELWHDLVKFCFNKKLFGLENLAFIPGYVGSAIVQNIGAYGLEISQLCEYVDILNIKTEKKYRLKSSECNFKYRDSIFKHQLKKNYMITSVGLKLKKKWAPVLHYHSLKINTKNKTFITPIEIYNTIFYLRKNTLPNYHKIGNAGSFFKNPILKTIKIKKIQNLYPDIPYFTEKVGYAKLSAAWLIEKSGLKGFYLNQTTTYYKHSVILINTGTKSGKNIAKLSIYIYSKVKKKFNISLEPEVQFIIYNGKTNFNTYVKKYT